MGDAERRVILGIFITTLSILLWRLSHSFIGWFFLAVPGAYLIVTGIIRILKEFK